MVVLREGSRGIGGPGLGLPVMGCGEVRGGRSRVEWVVALGAGRLVLGAAFRGTVGLVSGESLVNGVLEVRGVILWSCLPIPVLSKGGRAGWWVSVLRGEGQQTWGGKPRLSWGRAKSGIDCGGFEGRLTPV